MEQCPFCSYERKDLRRLVKHLLNSHAHTSGLDGPLVCVAGGVGIQCWCGCWFADAERFTYHLAQAGGLQPHLLAVGLGLEGQR